MRPGSDVWRKITSRSGPRRARQSRTRRSSVRRIRSPGKAAGWVTCRCRSRITACTAASRLRIGTRTGSQTASRGSGTVRPRGWLALGGRTGIGCPAAGGAFAETRPGGGDTLAVIATVGPARSRLLVGDGFARHGRVSVSMRRSRSRRPCGTRTSICRSFAMVSSGLCFFRASLPARIRLESPLQGGSLFSGQAIDALVPGELAGAAASATEAASRWYARNGRTGTAGETPFARARECVFPPC